MVSGHTLVLNRSWIPVHITSVRRALTLVYVGHARAVNPDDYSLHSFNDWRHLWDGHDNGNGHGRYMHSTLLCVRIPDVIVLSAFNGFVRHEVRFSRQSIFDRDGTTCQYCAKRFTRSRLTLDHVYPTSRGGADTWDNLVVACHKCNVRKAARTPEEAHMPLIRKPKKPAWAPHFGARVPSDQAALWRRFVEGPKSA
jgi:5-methylcytosine-specific restriction endonuclease McrA